MQLHQHQIIIITSRHLLGAAHTIKNQLNESAKTLCHLYDIPELNHHFLEGMQFPAAENRHTAIISMNSALFDKKISSRLKLTNEIITNQGYPVIEFLPQSSTILGQIFETIQWGSLITHQLTEMYQVNPTTLPYVDEFKAKLKQI